MCTTSYVDVGVRICYPKYVEQPISISGQIRELQAQGYSPGEIVKEIRARPGHKHVTLKQVKIALGLSARSESNKRLLEIYEISLEVLGIARELLSASRRPKIASRARQAEVEISQRVESRQPQSNPAVKPPL